VEFKLTSFQLSLNQNQTTSEKVEQQMDHDTLLLEKIWRGILNVEKIFQIIEAEYPSTSGKKPGKLYVFASLTEFGSGKDL
jgi:hypothetical protein